MPICHVVLLTPSVSSRLPQSSRNYHPKSCPVISFADPHPLTPVESYRFKNHGGKGALLATHHSPLHLNPLAATLMDLPTSIASKRLTSKRKAFRCNTYIKTGGTLLQPNYPSPSLPRQLLLPHLLTSLPPCFLLPLQSLRFHPGEK